MNRFQWKILSADAVLASKLARDLSISPLLARCLINRGCLDSQLAARFLKPRLADLKDPFLLPNIDLAVERLLRAHREQEAFVIFGDYDVDGVTSTALLTEFFSSLGWRCHSYLPHRIEEGYGLSRDAIENCVQKFQTKLLLAVDCGSTSAELIQELATENIEVIVLDHHQVGSPPPSCVAVVNPQLGSDPDAKNLCSAGLAFKLAHALLKKTRALGWPNASTFDLRPFLELVALGSIADMVPLSGENRILTTVGLQKLQGTQRPGLLALKNVAAINGSIGCYEVGYQLAPRLNAAGRLESAQNALDLLLTSDPAQAATLAQSLDLQNRERQAIEKKIADEVISVIRSRFDPASDFAIVEAHPDWHLGVVGIVASRVVREFHRPTVIVGSDGASFWRGSGRSIPGFDLAAGLRTCGDLLLKCGGHAMAAGVTIAAERIADLRVRLNQVARAVLAPDLLRPSLEIDDEVQLRDLHFHSLNDLSRIHPVGQGNPPVHFVARRLQVRGEPRPFGEGAQHCRLSVTDGSTIHQALWWNCGPGLCLPATFDLAFAPELSEFNGTFGIQLKVLDIAPSH